MKILIVTDGYPTEKYPLNGIFTYDQAKALQTFGHEVSIASIDLRSIRRWRKWGKYHFKRDNINIYNYSFPLGAIPLKIQFYFGKKLLKSLFKYILHQQGLPDIIHSHFFDSAYITTPIKEKYNIPFVITEHSSFINSENTNNSIFKYAKYAYLKADRVLAVSSTLAKKIDNIAGIKVTVVPNVLDLASIRKEEKTKRDKNHTFTLVSVGRLSQKKGFYLLIDAVSALKGKKYKLLIIGDGEEKNNLLKQINTAGLQDHVFLLGLKNRTEISDLLNRSDAFVLASHTETFGVVYIEAMAVGLPVIATACGGPEDFVTQENGILISPNNVNELKKALLKMYDNYQDYDRTKISEECMRKFSPHSIAAQLTTIYSNLIKSREL